MQNIYLVGFMATGKTEVGKKLAKRLNSQFQDLDDLIEAREKRDIPEIFAQQGEPYFRKIEKELLKDVSQKDNLVVACGGGIVLDKENISQMKSTGTMVCLTASADVIFKRTQGLRLRPLLNVDNPKNKIEELLKFREPFYAQANYTIDTSHKSVDEVVSEIIKIINGDIE